VCCIAGLAALVWHRCAMLSRVPYLLVPRKAVTTRYKCGCTGFHVIVLFRCNCCLLYSGFGGVGLASLRDAPAGALFSRSSQSCYHALRNVAMHVLVPI